MYQVTDVLLTTYIVTSLSSAITCWYIIPAQICPPLSFKRSAKNLYNRSLMKAVWTIYFSRDSS